MTANVWTKSSYSNPSGNCVEIATVPADADTTGLPAEVAAAVERKRP